MAVDPIVNLGALKAPASTHLETRNLTPCDERIGGLLLELTSSDAGQFPLLLAEGLFNVFERFRLRPVFLRNVPYGAMDLKPLNEPVPIYVDA